MIDDYWNVIQKGYNFGFDFDMNSFKNFGLVRYFV